MSVGLRKIVSNEHQVHDIWIQLSKASTTGAFFRDKNGIFVSFYVKEIFFSLQIRGFCLLRCGNVLKKNNDIVQRNRGHYRSWETGEKLCFDGE